MLTGALIGKVIGVPWLVIPIAFISHFILDAIPHSDTEIKNYSEKGITRENIKDLILCSLEPIFGIFLVIVLAGINPDKSTWIIVGAFFAILPDILEFLLRTFSVKSIIAILDKYHNNSKNYFFGVGIQVIISVISIVLILW